MTNNDVLNIIDNRPNLELLNALKDQIKRSEEVGGDVEKMEEDGKVQEWIDR